jgi:hypothetical protein
MDFSTVESVRVELLGKTRHLRLTLAAPGWYRTIMAGKQLDDAPRWYETITGGKRLDDLIMVLQRQLSAGVAAKRVNDAHAKALGVPVEQLPPDEVVNPDSILDPKDRIDIADMIPDVIAAVLCLAHWEDVINRPQGKKDIPLPGELTYEDMNTQLDLDAFPMLMVLIVQVYALHAMKAGKDTEGADPNGKSPVPPSSGLSEDASSDSAPMNF